jgi:cathepsin L
VARRYNAAVNSPEAMTCTRVLAAGALAVLSMSCSTTSTPTSPAAPAPAPAATSVQASEALGSATLPDAVDWRERGVVAPVKNQGACQSSWAFSATGALESLVAIKSGTLQILSEQQLVDCSFRDGNGGCRGGTIAGAFEYIRQKGGLASQASYPYTGREGTCKQRDPVPETSFSSLIHVRRGDEQALAAAVAQGPVAAELDGRWFESYRRGVMNAPCGRSLEHAVLIVGYGTDGAAPYWLIRNSLGSGWGESGYFRLLRGQNKCGIADAAVQLR